MCIQEEVVFGAFEKRTRPTQSSERVGAPSVRQLSLMVRSSALLEISLSFPYHIDALQRDWKGLFLTNTLPFAK